MEQRRWLRIIPVALIMYTISYIDRTNVSLALDPNHSTMMKDLLMDDKMKGEAAGIFFFGYLLLQIPGGYLASRWSARKLISWCLIAWGACAVGCGLAQTFRQFEVMRVLLGVAEGAVFPATLVLLASWFPSAERARANAYWNLFQPLAVAGSAPFTGWLLKLYDWHTMLILEGLVPLVWLPIWWFGIRDHPREAKWISAEEREHLETTLRREQAELESSVKVSPLASLFQPAVFVMVALYFLHNCAVYGCMTFFTTVLNGQGFGPVQTSLLFAVPYAVTAVIMILVSRHSDRTRERRGHVAAVYRDERHQPHPQRGLPRAFLAVVCIHVPGHSGAVFRHGAVLGHSGRDVAAKRNGPGHGHGQRLWQSGWLRRDRTSSARCRKNITARRLVSPSSAWVCWAARRWLFCCRKRKDKPHRTAHRPPQ